MPIKGLGIFVVDGKGKTQEPQSLFVSAKLAECRRRGDLTGGGHASERVFEGNRRVREAQKAVEVLERELQGMGGGVQVKQEGGQRR